MYRYWNGQTWSAALGPDPGAAPPTESLGSVAPGQPTSGTGPLGAGGTAPLGSSGGQYGTGQHTGGPGGSYGEGPGRKRSNGALIGLIVGVLVVAVVAVLAIRWLGDATGITGDPPGGQQTSQTCPVSDEGSDSPEPQPNDGRVHGGQLSYPLLGSPWSPPTTENRVPFGRGVLSQSVTIEPDYNGKGNSWVASVLIGRLLAGDGFFTPEQGSEIVVKCVVGAFYDNADVTRNDVKNEAMTVDGKDAWIVESELSFELEGLEAKGELLIVVIVQTSETSSSLFYASVPDNAPEQVQPARDALADLRVDS